MKKFLFILLFLFCCTSAHAIGVWTNEGTVIPQVSSDGPGQPNVLYEASGCVIKSNPCFKMWFATSNGICYAESAGSDGLSWTRYSGNPILLSGTVQFPKLVKESGTYYLYTGTATGNTGAYTSSDGITFTLQNANALVAGSQGWETGASTFFGQLGIVDIVAGTWYGYYTCYVTPANTYKMGLATSSDGITWTKDAGNPAISTYGPSNFHFYKFNGTYYGWSQIVIPGIPNYSSGLGLPSDIMRFTSPAANGPWTPIGYSTYYRTLVASEGIGLTTGQVADPNIVEANGNVYMYYTAKALGQFSGGGVINAAVAFSLTTSQLVRGYEGIIDIPNPWGSSALLQMYTLASDNFNRSDVNPLAGNWTTFFSGNGEGAAQIVSNKVESATIAVSGAVYYNALSWPNNQWSQITVPTFTGSVSYAGLGLRQNTSGTQTEYRVLFATVNGPPQLYIQKCLSGTFSNIGTGLASYSLTAGHTITASISNHEISVYDNGNLIWVASDSSISTGAAGFFVDPATSLGNSIVDNWSGGSLIDQTLVAVNQVGLFLVGP